MKNRDTWCVVAVLVVVVFLFFLFRNEKEGYDYRDRAAEELKKRFGKEGFTLERHEFNRGAGFPPSNLSVNVNERRGCFESSCPKSQVVLGSDYGRYYATCAGNPY